MRCYGRNQLAEAAGGARIAATGAGNWGALGTHNNEKRRRTLEDVSAGQPPFSATTDGGRKPLNQMS